MHPNEATAAAAELAAHFARLAALDLAPATNAAAIAYHRAEAFALLESLNVHLLFDGLEVSA